MLIDGRRIAQLREKKLRATSNLQITPKVVSIVIGDDEASHLYTKMKMEKAQSLGIDFEPRFFKEDSPYDEVINLIRDLNADVSVKGIMVQLPIPDQFLGGHDWKEVVNQIDRSKDIDGLKYPDSPFLPATALAVLSIIDEEGIEVSGKKVTVLGRSNLVGKPVAAELTKRGAEISVVHSKTKNPKEIVLDADIVISAVGKPYLVKKDWIKEGAVVIDVGTSPLDGKIVGDVEPEAAERASKMTPVPGGVGPMTVISLMENVLKSAN
jgi:methylenetetrahydrofolate dehydrogenase (NADP+) / methenyltetrahydrofolate cyclohydrolase